MGNLCPPLPGNQRQQGQGHKCPSSMPPAMPANDTLDKHIEEKMIMNNVADEVNTGSPTTNAATPTPDTRMVVALYTYEPRIADDLAFSKGHHILIIKEHDSDWWYGRNVSTDAEGYIPSNYVAPVATIQSHDWYVGQVTRKEAERMLLSRVGNVRGTFMVRESETTPASRRILPPGEQCEHADDVYEHLVEMVQPGGSVTADEGTSLHDRIRNTKVTMRCDDGTEEDVSYLQMFTFIWKAGLLKAVQKFLKILRKDERCVDGPVMLEICQRSRQLVELMLPPHVLCDANLLCDCWCRMTHRSLGNTRLIKHFITVKNRLRQAYRDIDRILLWIMISYVIDNMIRRPNV